jgi:hypothetical protein
MSQPTAQVFYNSICEVAMGVPRRIRVQNGWVRVAPLFLMVYPGGVKIDEAEFFITLNAEPGFRGYLANLFREDVLHTPRFIIGTAWESPGSFKVPFTELAAKIQPEDHQGTANAIKNQFFSEITATLKPRVGRLAIPLFAIEGHENAYLTNIATAPIALGQNYALTVSVAGLNLPETQLQRFRLELPDWEHIRLTPDTAFRRLLRKVRFLS